MVDIHRISTADPMLVKISQQLDTLIEAVTRGRDLHVFSETQGNGNPSADEVVEALGLLR